MIYQQRPLRFVMDERIRKMPMAKSSEPIWKSVAVCLGGFALIVAAIVVLP